MKIIKIDGNGWKLMKVDETGWDDWKWMEVDESGQENLEIIPKCCSPLGSRKPVPSGVFGDFSLDW